jgi:hypothetical protein
MRRFFIAVVIVLCLLGAWLGPDAWHHYQLYLSVQSERPHAYRVETRGPDYFSALVERRGWHVAATSAPQPDRTWDKVLDTLEWPRSLQSVERFYSTDTTRIGVVRWMLVPSSSKLPSLQTMVFRKLSGGIVYRDSQGRYFAEESSRSMVSLMQEIDGGVAEWLLVDDETFKRMEDKKRKQPNQALEPTPIAVTPRADARVAPSTAVAHL